MGEEVQCLKHTVTYCEGFLVDKYEFLCTVLDIKTLFSQGVGCSITTEVLALDVGKDKDIYKLCLYPNGYNQRVSGYVSLWLQKLSSKERLITFTCAIIGNDGSQVWEKSIKQRMGIESYIGFMTFCPRNVLVEDDIKVLKEGKLVFKFSIVIFCEKALPNPENESDDFGRNALSRLSDDLRSLFLRGLYPDFTIHVQGRMFSVHKAILCGRSAAFRNMLSSSSSNNSDAMTITDISEHTVEEMIGFIYSGQVGYLSFQEACELYYAAKKFDLLCLKNICCDKLKKNIKVENVLNALVLSERYSIFDLREICIQYAANNLSQVRHEEWAEFLTSQPQLANLILGKIYSKT